MKNKNLHNARRARNDEFYTQLPDIERELRHYKGHFEGKTVLCNCDDPRISNFFYYFSHNFEHLGLKKLITVCYRNTKIDLFSQNNEENAIYLEYDGAKKGDKIPTIGEIGIKYLEGSGDFRSDECIEILKQADIVCTNPPFSLFREYIDVLMRYDKKFLIIGNFNAVTYKEVFPLIKKNEIWLGVEPWGMTFDTPGGTEKFSRMTKWFTNLQHKKRNEELILIKKYYGNEKDYPKYDDYDAIEVSKVTDIPKDYEGIIGVPITFLVDYNPNQFEIVGDSRYITGRCKDINKILGSTIYRRILIRRKR